MVLTGAETGLVALWKFDEGRGTVSVDSASWRQSAGGGIARFGVLLPSVAVDSTANSLFDTISTAGGASADIGGRVERPSAPLATWAVSPAPVGGFARSYDGRPFFVRVNGTDAHVRALVAVLTRVPSGGSLAVAASIGASSSAADDEVLEIGDAVNVGTRLIYRPEVGAHDPWSEGVIGKYGGITDWTAEGEPFDSFAYRVQTEDGEVSENEAVVALSVRPEMNAAHFDWPIKVSE